PGDGSVVEGVVVDRRPGDREVGGARPVAAARDQVAALDEQADAALAGNAAAVGEDGAVRVRRLDPLVEADAGRVVDGHGGGQNIVDAVEAGGAAHLADHGTRS